ncbi:MAG: dTDP-4-dehydrorhamnose reductase [Planctomycetota bacterium]|nr:dTDP-4-dehydrorhamnose reductase [Planctomycetota bacterium]
MSVFNRVVITGGGGMLAGALRRTLEERRIKTHVLDRAACDVTDARSVDDLFELRRPTLVLNCAAYTKVDLAEQESELANRVNGTGAANLARGCAASGAKLVHFSTDYVFDGTLRRPLRPDDPVGPQSAYGKSKLLGEQAIQGVTGLDYLVLRTAWLYGTGGANFVKTMVTVAKAGKPLRVINDQFGSPTSTLDLAAATLELLDRDATGILHVSNAGETNWFDFARAIFQEWNLTPDLGPTTSDAWKAQRPESATRPAYSVLDVSPFQELVGHPMRDWRDALSAFKAQVDRSGTF